MLNKEIFDRKYAQLLLKKCLNFTNSDTLLIDYQTHEFDGFINILEEEAQKMNIKNIIKHICDIDELHEYYKRTKIDDIKFNPLIDRSIWDEVARKNGCILHIITYIPNIMDDVDQEKMTKVFNIRSNTFNYYKQNNSKYAFPWNICAYPNKRWANYLFSDDPNSFDKLYNYIMQSCLIDKDNPIEEWDKYIKISNYYKNKLNELGIKKLYYKNNLGTNLEVGMPNNYQWLNLDKKDIFGNPIICNMPSYEIFTSPDYKSAKGIVYNSKPLIYEGKIIDKFYLEFKDGIVVNYKAQVGNDILKSIIESCDNSNRIGEVALVNYDSPISNTNIIFYETLFDENASCHMALGDGFHKAIINSEKLNSQELKKYGINESNIHVDYMIGTKDLDILADTKYGKKLIFKNGNFNI